MLFFVSGPVVSSPVFTSKDHEVTPLPADLSAISVEHLDVPPLFTAVVPDVAPTSAGNLELPWLPPWLPFAVVAETH